MPVDFVQFRKETARYVRYIYFMRFSLVLWLFPLGLVVADFTATRSLTSGLLVPEFLQGYLCVGFFLASTGYVALIAARVVAINGPERWGEAGNDLPRQLKKLLVNDRGEHETAAVVISQLPNILAFAYLYWNATVEAVLGWRVWTGLLSGAALAIIFWYGANAWYYLNYKVPQQYKSLSTLELGKNAARTILFPRSWFFPYTGGKANRARAGKSRQAEEGPVKLVRLSIEEATTEKAGNWVDGPIHWFAGFLTRYIDPSGYFYPDGRLYEAHIFSAVAVAMYFVLYLVIWPLAAPVPAETGSKVALALTALAVIRVVWVFCRASGGQKSLLAWKIGLCVGVIGFWSVIAGFYVGTDAERFPILATVLIMVIALCWTFGGIAFCVDRYRVPVVTLIVVLMIVPRWIHLDRFLYFGSGPGGRGHEEHYLSTVATAADAKRTLQTPAEILEGHLLSGDRRPLIIVTATGGGLHAAAWTATVLSHLEKEFGPDFHKHLLLASTVSGGSIGLLTYLHILHDGSLDENPALALARMQSAAQCSSLEGVGWGLVYYDLPKAFVPLLPYVMPTSSGDGDLDHLPLGKDQTWSLRKSFGRNLNDAYCEELWAMDNQMNLKWDQGRDPNSHPEEALTLRAFPPATEFPAFTMNTTTVEDGNRFLLANYRVSDSASGAESDYRARSFLATFGGQDASVDLPLATAAQMSATFPYVSSAARVPLSIDNDVNSVHFVDGGYYDNDGTASAIEFLRFALAPGREARSETNASAAKPAGKAAVAEPQEAPVRILLIEIRNSGDVSPGVSENNPDRTNSKYPWNLTDQANAPLLAFWQAGHESVTARNRVGLGMLEKALKGRLQLHHIVLADNDSDANAGTDPLNWSLTPKQRREVQKSANGLEPCYANAKSWFSNWDDLWGKPAQPQPQGCDLKANSAEVSTVP